MSGRDDKKEFGDYQTPKDFCDKVCKYLKQKGFVNNVTTIFEPTCGLGNFLVSASKVFESSELVGVEINHEYVNAVKETIPSAIITEDSIFNINSRELCNSNDVLVIGNPPWVTNSDLVNNLPQKINFKGLRGIDALTGSSNFDICEYIILKLIDEYKDSDSTICMLCKTSVARNVILEIQRNSINYEVLEMLNFNSNKVFGISASACVFVVKLTSSSNKRVNTVCVVKDFETEEELDTLTVCNGVIKSSKTSVDLEGKCQLVWRQGVKHDCGKVMELDIVGNYLINKKGETVEIESDLIFPLVKSSHFKKCIINDFSKMVLVTQTKPKQDTAYIETDYPKTWEYLTNNIESFNNRKSVIYKKSAPFSMFGIGDYSFAPYKVGLSGFYKKPLFCLLHSNKPVMTDDTAYFLSFDNYETAYTIMLLLNSRTVQDFLLSIAFLDNKRPYTVKLLSRLDIIKCMDNVSFDEIVSTEVDLGLETYVTEEMYIELRRFIEE